MHISYTYIVNERLTFCMFIFEPMISKLQCNCKNDNEFSHTSSKHTIEVSHSILMPTSQCFHHIQFILYIFGSAHHTSHRNHENAIFPHKARRTILQEQEKELIRLSDAIA